MRCSITPMRSLYSTNVMRDPRPAFFVRLRLTITPSSLPSQLLLSPSLLPSPTAAAPTSSAATSSPAFGGTSRSCECSWASLTAGDAGASKRFGLFVERLDRRGAMTVVFTYLKISDLGGYTTIHLNRAPVQICTGYESTIQARVLTESQVRRTQTCLESILMHQHEVEKVARTALLNLGSTILSTIVVPCT